MLNPTELFKKTIDKVDKNLCFILMPFRDEFSELYEDIIKPTIEETGLISIRADEIYSVNAIISDIWNSIQKSAIIIADLTNRNPNVLYELGLCHAIRKNVIIITQNLEDVPFDLKHLRLIEYKLTPRSSKLLQQTLRKTLLAIKGNFKDEQKYLSFEYINKFGQRGRKPGQFNNIRSLALDTQGNIYISDGDNHRIEVFSNNGKLLKYWGKRGTGEGEFDSPRGVLVDNDGFIYLADQDNNRVQIFDKNGKYIRQFGNDNLVIPYGLVMDNHKNIYITCPGSHQIKKFDYEGKLLLEWGHFGKGEGEFNNPLGINMDIEKNIFVVDNCNHRIQKFTKDGEFILSWGRQGKGAGSFDLPHSIGIDNNLVYISESNLPRIQIFDVNGLYIGEIKQTSNVVIHRATGLCLDENNCLYIANRGLNQILVIKGLF